MLLYTVFGFGASMCRAVSESLANLVSLVSTSLFIGYCTGAAIVLRAALDPSAYVHLFDDDPERSSFGSRSSFTRVLIRARGKN